MKTKEDIQNLRDRLVTMKQRCYNPKNPKYKHYGARGITICEEWLNNSNTFIEWALTNGFKRELQIDRIDNDDSYTPENCRWVTPLVQQRNRGNILTDYVKKTRICFDCRRRKPLSEFHRSSVKGRFGYQQKCKECRRKESKERYLKKKGITALLKSVKDGFRRRFNWSQMQPSEVAAENYFTEQGWKFERFGWDRTKIYTLGLPEKYRYIPDYLVDKGKKIYALYESKGFSSRGAVLRLKVSMYEVLEEHYTADLELRILAYALPSEELYDVPFSVFKRDLAKFEEAHDGATFFVFPIALFEEFLV